MTHDKLSLSNRRLPLENWPKSNTEDLHMKIQFIRETERFRTAVRLLDISHENQTAWSDTPDGTICVDNAKMLAFDVVKGNFLSWFSDTLSHPGEVYGGLAE